MLQLRRLTFLFLTLLTLQCSYSPLQALFGIGKDTPEKAVKELNKELTKFRKNLVKGKKTKGGLQIKTFEQLSKLPMLIEKAIQENEKRDAAYWKRLQDNLKEKIKKRQKDLSESLTALEERLLGDTLTPNESLLLNGKPAPKATDDERLNIKRLLNKLTPLERSRDHKTETFKLPSILVIMVYYAKIVDYRTDNSTAGFKTKTKVQKLVEEFTKKNEKHGDALLRETGYDTLQQDLAATLTTMKEVQAGIKGILIKLGIPRERIVPDADKIKDLQKEIAKVIKTVQSVKGIGRKIKTKNAWKKAQKQADHFRKNDHRNALFSPLNDPENHEPNNANLVNMTGYRTKSQSLKYLGLKFVFDPKGSKNGLYGAIKTIKSGATKVLSMLDDKKDELCNLTNPYAQDMEEITLPSGETDAVATKPSLVKMLERKLTPAARQTYWGYWWSRVKSYVNTFFAAGIETVYYRLVAQEALEKLEKLAPFVAKKEDARDAEDVLMVLKDLPDAEHKKAAGALGEKVKTEILIKYNAHINVYLADHTYFNQAAEYKKFVEYARRVMHAIDKKNDFLTFGTGNNEIRHYSGRVKPPKGQAFGVWAPEDHPEYQTEQNRRHLFPYTSSRAGGDQGLVASDDSESMRDFDARKEIDEARSEDTENYHIHDNMHKARNGGQNRLEARARAIGLQITRAEKQEAAHEAGYKAGKQDYDDNLREPANYERDAESKYPDAIDANLREQYIDGYLDAWAGEKKSLKLLLSDRRSLAEKNMFKRRGERHRSDTQGAVDTWQSGPTREERGRRGLDAFKSNRDRRQTERNDRGAADMFDAAEKEADEYYAGQQRDAAANRAIDGARDARDSRGEIMPYDDRGDMVGGQSNTASTPEATRTLESAGVPPTDIHNFIEALSKANGDQRLISRLNRNFVHTHRVHPDKGGSSEAMHAVETLVSGVTQEAGGMIDDRVTRSSMTDSSSVMLEDRHEGPAYGPEDNPSLRRQEAEGRAATQIQSAWRGNSARKQVRGMRNERYQAVQRKEIQERYDRLRAVTPRRDDMQSRYLDRVESNLNSVGDVNYDQMNGFMDRADKEVRGQAARTLRKGVQTRRYNKQASSRANTWQDLAGQERSRHAATQIQSAWRGKQARAQVGSMRSDSRKPAPHSRFRSAAHAARAFTPSQPHGASQPEARIDRSRVGTSNEYHSPASRFAPHPQQRAAEAGDSRPDWNAKAAVSRWKAEQPATNAWGPNGTGAVSGWDDASRQSRMSGRQLQAAPPPRVPQRGLPWPTR